MGLGCINVRSNFIEDYLNKAFDTILVEMFFLGGGAVQQHGKSSYHFRSNRLMQRKCSRFVFERCLVRISADTELLA